MKTATVKLRVSEADKTRFEAVAALDGRTLSEEIRWLVVQRLAELEEQAAARAAARRRRGYHDQGDPLDQDVTAAAPGAR